METLTRLVSESLARHGFDRPLDYRRLQWSRWFRCESHHSLLLVPSKPGVFALAEEVMSLGTNREGHDFSRAESGLENSAALAADGNGSLSPEAQVQEAEAESQKPEADPTRRMLAVTQFFEDDDMAYVLDRMLSRNHPIHSRLESGRYFIRYVEIHDPVQRRSICSALNQWIASSSEKATGIGSHFATSLELTPTIEPVNVGRTLLSANSETGPTEARGSNLNNPANKSAPPEVVADPGIHRSSLFPSGF